MKSIRSSVKKILKKIIKVKINTTKETENKNVFNFLEVGDKTIIKGLKYEIRDKSSNTKFIEIGDESIIDARIVIENKNGFIKIGKRTSINSSFLISITNISIGNNVWISWGCTIVDHDSHSINSWDRMNDFDNLRKGLEENDSDKYKNWELVPKSPVIIHDNVWVGMNCIILKGVTIGQRSIIAAGSVVVKNIPEDSLAAGNPAKVIRKLVN